MLACAGTVALVGAWAVPASRRTLAPFALASLAVTIATWGLHADEAAATRRIESLADASPRWSAATRAETFDVLGARALNTGNPARGAELFDRAVAVGGPNPRLLYQSGMAYTREGHLDQARARFASAAEGNRALAGPWVGLATVAFATGDSTRGRACLDSALARDPRYGEALELARATAGFAPR